MLSFEERLTAVEQSQKRVAGNIDEINHHMTILLGVVSNQEKDIKEIKASVASIDGRLNAFEQNVNSRFEKVEGRLNAVENRLDTFEQNVNSRFEKLEGRFDTLEGRFEKQDEKLDNVVVLLNTLIAQRG
jgi:chromosome segregation ATPase